MEREMVVDMRELSDATNECSLWLSKRLKIGKKSS
jgi:hypothetical protein